MKVCAHYSLGPFSSHFVRAASVNDAVKFFRDSLESYYGSLDGILDRTGEECAPTMHIYPQCDDCTDTMCFHDYPQSAFTVGPRGGIRRVIV